LPTFCELSAHSETLGASAKTPVRERMQDSAGWRADVPFCCITPQAAASGSWPLCAPTGNMRATSRGLLATSGSARQLGSVLGYCFQRRSSVVLVFLPDGRLNRRSGGLA
jgi:hypothetical protein